MVGWEMLHNASISCWWFAPISTTAISCDGFMESSVSGTPMWLLRFPKVYWTLYFCISTVLMSSFVVVLPLLPVSPITGMVSCCLWCLASACKKSKVEGTKNILRSLFSNSCCSTITAKAPCSTAFSAKVAALKFSPEKAKKISFCSIFRLSMVTLFALL